MNPDPRSLLPVENTNQKYRDQRSDSGAFGHHCCGPTVVCYIAFFFCAHSLQQSRDVELWLQLLDQVPLVHGHIAAVKLLERVNASPRDERIENVFLFELASI
jgi:hypothetical protein